MRISVGMMTFLVGLLLLAIAGMIYQQSLISSGRLGVAATTAGTQAGSTMQAKKIMYVCPMHSQVRQEKPGTCPICGMELVPETPSAAASAPPATAQAPGTSGTGAPPAGESAQAPGAGESMPGMEMPATGQAAGAGAPAMDEGISAVKLSPTQAVLSDIQPIKPTRELMALKIPTIGEVQVPENKMNMLVSWQEGRVDKLLLREAGGKVKKGEHILDIYSEDLVQAQQEYLLALDAVDKLGDSGYGYIADSTKKLLDASRQKLLRLGLTAGQVGQLESTRQVEEHVPIYANYGGTVMEKKVTEGMYVMRGEELYSVADLSKVWVIVRVFEKDAASLKAGDRVTFKSSIQPGATFKGTVLLIEPELDMETKTHRARVVVDNAKGLLKPGEILDAEINVDYGELLLLPRNAVLHTGDGDLVYVQKGNDMWEPRRVMVGRDFGDKVEILSGLSKEESVAGTAVFLLDSEAQTRGVPRPVDIPNAPGSADSGSANGQH